MVLGQVVDTSGFTPKNALRPDHHQRVGVVSELCDPSIANRAASVVDKAVPLGVCTTRMLRSLLTRVGAPPPRSSGAKRARDAVAIHALR